MEWVGLKYKYSVLVEAFATKRRYEQLEDLMTRPGPCSNWDAHGSLFSLSVEARSAVDPTRIFSHSVASSDTAISTSVLHVVSPFLGVLRASAGELGND